MNQRYHIASTQVKSSSEMSPPIRIGLQPSQTGQIGNVYIDASRSSFQALRMKKDDRKKKRALKLNALDLIHSVGHVIRFQTFSGKDYESSSKVY